MGFGVGEFGGEDEGVEGDVTFDAVGVEEGHQAGEVFFGEVVGAKAGIEAGHAEVDGVGAVGDGGAGAVPVTGGREEFGEEGHWDCGLRIGDCGLGIGDWGLGIADCGLRIAGCGLRIADCGLRIADCGLRIGWGCKKFEDLQSRGRGGRVMGEAWK